MPDWYDDFASGPKHRRVIPLDIDDDDEPPPTPDPVPVRPGVLAAFDPGRRGIRALAIVAAVVVCVAAFFAWRARPHATPVPSAVTSTSVASLVAGSSTPAMVVVAVNGRVHKPGLVRLASGSRVADAIDAAGGVLPDTDLTALNLARKVVDGELIVVGAPAPPAGGAPAAGAPGGQLNLNTATLAELQTLPGIGQVLAQRILDYRTAHGQFQSVNELRQIDGIGAATFEKLKDKVTV